MSRWDESYDDRRKREREERRQYENDVAYEVWRSGGDIDRIDYDRIDDCCYDGQDPEHAAAVELAAQRRRDNPGSEPTGHFTGRCSQCGSQNLWDDNLAYGCNDCGAFLGSN